MHTKIENRCNSNTKISYTLLPLSNSLTEHFPTFELQNPSINEFWAYQKRRSSDFVKRSAGKRTNAKENHFQFALKAAHGFWTFMDFVAECQSRKWKNSKRHAASFKNTQTSFIVLERFYLILLFWVLASFTQWPKNYNSFTFSAI